MPPPSPPPPTFGLAVDGTAVVATDVPADAHSVKLFLNGLAVWFGPVDRTAGGCVRAPFAEIVSATNMMPTDDLHLPRAGDTVRGVLLQSHALDADRRIVARGRGTELPLHFLARVTEGHPDGSARGPAAARGPASPPPPGAAGETEDVGGPVGVNRLVASTVHQPGDRHTYDLRLRRMVRVSSGSPAGDAAAAAARRGSGGEFALVYVRVVFDVDAALFGVLQRQQQQTQKQSRKDDDDDAALATLRFDLQLNGTDVAEHRPSTAGDRSGHRRSALLSMGQTSSVFRLTGPECTDAVFVGCVPHWCVAAASVRCELQTSAAADVNAVWSLRYAIYGTVQAHLVAPPLLPAAAEGIEDNPAAAAAAVNPVGPIGRKLAVVVGVSKYSARAPPSDLRARPSGPDDDVTHWYNYLRGRQYDVRVYGDTMSPYPAWHGPATVLNVRDAVRKMVEAAHGPRDRVAFVMSGHGDRDVQSGNAFLCLLPDAERGRSDAELEGRLFAADLAADLGMDGRNRARTWVFLDCCRSGGLIDGLLRACPSVVGSTTATRDGQGYEHSMTQSGAWTNEFLLKGLIGADDASADLCDVFRRAYDRYTRRWWREADAPCFFGRADAGKPVHNTENLPAVAVRALPEGAFRVNEWL